MEGKIPKIRPVIRHSIHCALPTPPPQHEIAALLLLWKLFVRLCMDSGEGRVARTFARYVGSSFLLLCSNVQIQRFYSYSMVTGFYLNFFWVDLDFDIVNLPLNT